MARLPRIVLPGIPHHITQRGNGRQRTFFEDGDFELYQDLLAEGANHARCEIWSYCLMPNHVHIIIVPSDEDGLRRALGETHRRYTGYINARRRTTGHLWQGRFGSVAMDDVHCVSAFRYIALNPVRAKLVKRAEQWQWSSTKALMQGADDGIVSTAPVLERTGDFASFLDERFDEEFTYAALRKAEKIGRPIGSEQWIEAMEAKSGLQLKPAKRGPKTA